jgi:hypothetical protein
VFIVVVVIAFTFIVANVVINARNVVDFHGYPSSLHKCPHQFMDVPHPLESWYHPLFYLFPLFPHIFILWR